MFGDISQVGFTPVAEKIKRGCEIWETLAAKIGITDLSGIREYSTSWVKPEALQEYGIVPPVAMIDVGFRMLAATILCVVGYGICRNSLPIAVRACSYGWYKARLLQAAKLKKDENENEKD